MKKLLVVFMAAVLLTACGSKSDGDTDTREELVIVTSPDYAPYEFYNPNKTGQEAFVGADVELAKYIAEKLDKKLVLEAMNFSDIPTAVRQGTYDLGISGFTYEKERAEVVAFSKGYDNSESTCQGFLVKKDKLDEYKTLDDFKKITLAVQNGSVQQKYAEKDLAGADLQLIGQLDDGALQLKTDKVDAVVISCAAGEGFVANNPEFAVSEVTFDIVDEAGMMVITNKDNTELLDQINTIIDEVVAQDLYAKWLEEAIQLKTELGIE